jgi:hypothetical protein
MATYREIKGLRVPYLSSDLPSASASTQEAQVWYNSSTGKLRTFVAYDTWATTSPINTGRNTSVAGGTQTAGLVAMGTPFLNSTEEYNGSGWSSGGNINTAREEGGSGGSVHTQTAAIIFAGRTPPSTAVAIAETYDGSSWTEIADLNTARRSQLGGAGSTTACIAFGGNNPDPVGDQTESWNGTAWTEVADMNEPVSVGGGSAGSSSTSAFCAGGYGPPSLPQARLATVEEWDGSSWTETADLNTARYELAGAGTTTAAVYFGGNNPSPAKVAITESFDGTSWTETADLPAATQSHSGTGSSSAALMISGNGASPAGTVCAEFQKSLLTYTPSSWASGTNLPGNFNDLTQFGTLTAAVIGFGELGGAANAEAFHYDGSAWTAGGNAATVRNMAVAAGTETAGLVAMGYSPPAPTKVVAVHEQYDGSAWSEEADLNTGRGYGGSANSGTTTAALVFGGLINPELAPSPFGAVGEKNESEEWNGSAWTEGDNLNTARWYTSGLGIQTAALCVAGNISHPNNTSGAVVESYDGSSWTEVGDVSTARQRSMAFGTTTSGLAIGGGPSAIATVEAFDGTAWATSPALNAAKSIAGGSGNTSDGLISGGNSPGTNTSDEWTAASSAAEAADIDFD